MFLVPDYDRASDSAGLRVIDAVDRQKADTGDPFRLWINDDEDTGDCGDDGGADIPGQTSSPNHADGSVNGRRDLLDFFPLLIDVGRLESVIGTSHSYRLKQANGALGVVYTKLGNLNAGWYLTHDVANCGPGLDASAHSAASLSVTATGAELSPYFVAWMRQNGGKGVILVEGTADSSAPLVLEAVKDGAVIASVGLPLRIKPVEQMFVRVDLRGGGAAVVTSGGAMPPDNGTNVVFLHGLRVNPSMARAWWSEVFKKLWQSGSNARFHGVTWFSDDGFLLTDSAEQGAFRYHVNVCHAFETAPHLKDYVNSGISGQKIIMAHSLGNMVVSSALADHGMGVGKYFMLNAAVASEALDSGLWSDRPDVSNVMAHEYWLNYTNVCWSAKFHEFFAGNPDDARRLLTWKDRFTNALAQTDVYNMYSAGSAPTAADGDEVFELYNGTPSTLGNPADLGRYSWHLQETHKGRFGLPDPAATSWAGWGFEYDSNCQFTNGTSTWTGNTGPGILCVNGNGEYEAVLFDETDAHPVFRRNPPAMFSSNITAAVRNEILAKGLPSLSPAAGKAEIGPPERNFNMNTAFKPDAGAWGRDDSHMYKKRWLHADMQDMAFFYTHKLFGKLVELGEMK